ncbi:MAG TPA: zinc metallopeptidase [Kiritimatiellia bacterium]|nr:zinc metallopeptidase [Kiritimatiellia bacterium]
MTFDPVYFLFALPALLLSLYATALTQSRFLRFSQIQPTSGMTGAEAARALLAREGLHDVEVVRTGGFLSDHYDPSGRVLRLSPDVYGTSSLSAVGVACHEAGHALQHASGYVWLGFRNALVPVTQIGSYLSYAVLMLGFMLQHPRFIALGLGLFALGVLLSLATLPVEWDASARARRLMVSAGIVGTDEQEAAGQVLTAAFLTYVAAAVSSLLTFLYYLMRSGLLGGRRSD